MFLAMTQREIQFGNECCFSSIVFPDQILFSHLTSSVYCCYNSRTVQNILLRHGWTQHADFLFGSPISKNYLKSGPKHFTVEAFEEDVMPHRHKEIMKNGKYDISALHARWNRTAIQLSIVPYKPMIDV